jgi:hypothetical protein
MALHVILKHIRPRLFFFALLLAAAPALRSQAGASLRVNVLRQLVFGQLIGGVDAAMGPADSKATALFEIIGPVGATVQLVFTLPAELIGEGGGRVGLSFGAQSAAYSLNESSADNIPFDPRAPFTLKLPANGRVVVMIGGMAKPSRQLVSGRYTGNLSLSVTTQ